MTGKFARAVLICLMSGAAAIAVAAQTPSSTSSTANMNAMNAPGTQQTPPDAANAPAQTVSNIDENFELNIDLRRITERDFEASTAIDIGDEGGRGLNLQVGVAVAANRIDVLLRNIRGRVRFRATLEPVLQRINSRRAPITTGTTTSSNVPQ